MFAGCTSLETVGNISATQVSSDPGYNTMFEGCNALQKVGVISVTVMLGRYYENMFKNSSIIEIGGISNKSIDNLSVYLPDNCYEGMFSGCISLTFCEFIIL
jgi:hypothetical protein